MDEYLITLAKIYEINIIKKEHVWFTKLVGDLKEILSKGQVSRSLDKLYGLGIINTEDQKLDNVWTHTITVSSESERFVREMYEKSKLKMEIK